AARVGAAAPRYAGPRTPRARAHPGGRVLRRAARPTPRPHPPRRTKPPRSTEPRSLVPGHGLAVGDLRQLRCQGRRRL
ncbi:hypothetical protein GTY88_13610, partial [Streptomyces sp. SID5926]|nr:hypothetical protein [Streptomyces sp. SID5926]